MPVGVDGVEHAGRADVVVRGEPQGVAAGHGRALPAAAAEDPDLDLRALTGHGVRVGPFGGTVGAAEEGEDVVDLFAVVG